MPGAIATDVAEESDVTGLPERHAQVGDVVVVAIDEEAADAGTIDADRRLSATCASASTAEVAHPRANTASANARAIGDAVVRRSA